MFFIVNSKKELYIADKSPYKALENLFLHIWYSRRKNFAQIHNCIKEMPLVFVKSVISFYAEEFLDRKNILNKLNSEQKLLY
jgi:hypothetical protein